jgi:hypothetical protein
MKIPHKRLVVIGSFLLVVAVIVPAVFALWTFLGPQSYRAVAVVHIYPFIPTAFDRSVHAAAGVGPSVSIEQYRGTALFHVAVVAPTPQIASEQADAAAKRMLASLEGEPSDESTLFERPQRPLHPHRPNFRVAMLTIMISSAAFGLAGSASLMSAFISRRKAKVGQYACA